MGEATSIAYAPSNVENSPATAAFLDEDDYQEIGVLHAAFSA